MLVTLPPLKILIRVSRPPKVAIKQWASWKDRRLRSSATLVSTGHVGV